MVQNYFHLVLGEWIKRMFSCVHHLTVSASRLRVCPHVWEATSTEFTGCPHVTCRIHFVSHAVCFDLIPLLRVVTVENWSTLHTCRCFKCFHRRACFLPMSQLVRVFANIVHNALTTHIFTLPARHIVIRLPILQPLQDSLILLGDLHQLTLTSLSVKRFFNWRQLAHCATHLCSSILAIESFFAHLVLRLLHIALLLLNRGGQLKDIRDQLTVETKGCWSFYRAKFCFLSRFQSSVLRAFGFFWASRRDVCAVLAGWFCTRVSFSAGVLGGTLAVGRATFYLVVYLLAVKLCAFSF